MAGHWFSYAGIVIALGTMSAPAAGQGGEVRRPNIIVIVADDLGYGDIGGYYGADARTPHLNKLATEGMVFSDFHSNGPMCSPTRAAFLTGRYQQRLGIERALPTDWHDRGIGSDHNRDEITIGSYFQRLGYRTAVFGKWHLGKHPVANPIYHGFDEFRGLTCGCGDYFSKLDRNGFPDWWHNDKLSFQDGYATDVISDNAVDFIKRHQAQPFFLYVAYSAIHFPWQSAEDYDEETRHEGGDFTSVYPGKQSKLGPHEPNELRDVVRRMIRQLDEGIGRIIRAVKDAGMQGNTLVIFTSDNGGYRHYHNDTWPSVSSNGQLRGQKGQLYEGGHRVPGIAWWPGNVPAGSVSHATVMTFDLLPTFLELLGQPMPPEGSRNALDGRSILKVLLENAPLETRPLFWRMGEQKSVRHGAWKVVISKQAGVPELYNLTDDIAEQRDVSRQFPGKTEALLSLLSDWEKEVSAPGE